MCVNGWDGDPTTPPPPQDSADGPAPAYAVIHTSHHIPQNTTPHHSKSPTPGGIYIFQKVLANVRFCV